MDDFVTLSNANLFSVLDEEQRQENASSRTNKRRRLDVVQVCPDFGGFFDIAHLFTSFRGDMVELLKGPDKGKLGIIKMIVQVYFPTITKTAKYKYIYLDDADAAMTFTSTFPGA